jgi:hypothetical protein
MWHEPCARGYMSHITHACSGIARLPRAVLYLFRGGQVIAALVTQSSGVAACELAPGKQGFAYCAAYGCTTRCRTRYTGRPARFVNLAAAAVAAGQVRLGMSGHICFTCTRTLRQVLLLLPDECTLATTCCIMTTRALSQLPDTLQKAAAVMGNTVSERCSRCAAMQLTRLAHVSAELPAAAGSSPGCHHCLVEFSA